ncbi:hypothetical protein TSAR_004864 [Trichomalopsis sarcophagae]|uniref:DNA helicase n=1 Tax=Trichomalopsis sarcophagae TaxID=543379 RepID=A0A232EGF8_9HYME|nr:hypothetical protein TSAR_004864 [Trichomalopsis sarcophagae]
MNKPLQPGRVVGINDRPKSFKIKLENENVIERNKQHIYPYKDQYLENAFKDAENDLYDDIDDESISKQVNLENVDILQQTGNEKYKKKNIYRITVPNLIDEEHVFQMIDELNSDQKDIVRHVLNCFKNNLLPIKIFLSGSDGVDEISMVGSMLRRIDTRLRQIFGINKSFGGISVILVGDLYQLLSVMDRPIYTNAKSSELSVFCETLNNLAIGELTDKDLLIINSRSTNEKDMPEEAIRLFGENKHVDEYNANKIRNHPETNVPNIIWMNFGNNTKTGSKVRTKFKQIIDNLKISKNLVPITKIYVIINIKDNHQIIRKQLPLIPAEALTVHKSQSQTYDKIVRQLSDLYINGEFKNLNKNKSDGNLKEIMKNLTLNKNLNLYFTKYIKGNGIITFFNYQDIK